MTRDGSLFEIMTVPDRRLMRIAMRGFWTEATIAEYDVAVQDAALAMARAGCPRTEILAFVDARELDAQAQPLIANYQSRFSAPDRQPRRIATVVSKALVRMQAQRVAFANQQIFTDEREAMDWLLHEGGS